MVSENVVAHIDGHGKIEAVTEVEKHAPKQK